MSEKHLTEPSWKTIVTKEKVKDTGLGKALAEYGKCAENDHAARLKALEAIEKQAGELKKANKDHATTVDYLTDVLTEAVKTRKIAELQVKSPKKDETKGEGGKEEKEQKEEEQDEEYDADAIKKKMISFLGTVRTRAPGDPQLQFMSAIAGTACGVLLAPKVGSTQKKLLTSILGGASGAKYLSGDCIWELNTHTFVLEQSPPGGLAKKLSKAILDETGQRYKVRVRSADGSMVLDSDTDVDEVAPPQAPIDPAKLTEAMNKLAPGIKALLGSKPALKDDLVAKLAAFKGFMDGEQLVDARGILFELAALVKGVGERNAETSGGQGDFAKVEFEKIHLDWDARKSEVEARLKTLHGAIVADWDDPTAMTAAQNLQKVLARFNEGLGDTLDAFRNSADAASRGKLATKASGIVDRYLAYLNGDRLVAHVEVNPFDITVATRDTLSAPLLQLRGQLAKLTAGVPA